MIGPRATGHIFCERCGVSTALTGSGGASFCLACRSYLCAACGLEGALRCAACRELRTQRPKAGIRAARDALGVLEEVEWDLRALADGGAAGGLSTIGDALLELEVKRRAAEEAAEHALAASRAPDRGAVEELLGQLAGTLGSIEFAVEELRRADDAAQPTWPLPTVRPPVRAARTAFDWRKRARPVRVGIVGVAAVVVVIAALTLWPREVPRPPADEVAIETPPTTGAVAGSTGTPVPSPPSSASVPAVESWTFDDVEMGSNAPAGFKLAGPDDALSVAAVPTAVDRSLRLSGSASPSSVCHALSAAPTQVAVRLRLQGALLGGSELVELVGPDGEAIVAVALSNSGAVELLGSSHALVVSTSRFGQWYEVTVGLAPDGTATVVAMGEDGTVLGRAAVSANDPIDGAQEICFGLPAGSPAAELYINDVEITY
ncbi:MAG: hypothetical protein H0U86_07490 [Chloroflexi bacterium]|nr:hypothetical protein [Chloroflexota bacterium]